MKSILFLGVFIFLAQINFAQDKGIKVEQLFITNKITGKSVKLFSNEEKLKNFGELLEVKNNDLQFTTADYAKSYIFTNIIFNISAQAKISSFKTSSPDILIEKRGFFSISVGTKISELEKYFPEEVKNADLINFGKDKVQYLVVRVPLFDNNPFLKKDMEIDFAICFMFNPESKNLELVYLWIRP